MSRREEDKAMTFLTNHWKKQKVGIMTILKKSWEPYLANFLAIFEQNMCVPTT